jgi:hypothetical protein
MPSPPDRMFRVRSIYDRQRPPAMLSWKRDLATGCIAQAGKHSLQEYPLYQTMPAEPMMRRCCADDQRSAETRRETGYCTRRCTSMALVGVRLGGLQRTFTMATYIYIVLANFTDQGIRNIKATRTGRRFPGAREVAQ